MLNVLILENERALLMAYEQILEACPDVAQLKLTDTPESFELALKDFPADVCLIDIDLGATRSGLDMARLTRQLLPQAEIIFASAHVHHMRAAFEVRAFDFITKPLSPEELCCVLRRVRQSGDASRVPHLLVHSGKNRCHRLRMQDILCIDHSRYKTLVCTAHQMIETYEPLRELVPRLSSDFVQCHRAVWVNLHHVVSMEPDCLTLDNGMRCDLSRKYRQQCIQSLARFTTIP